MNLRLENIWEFWFYDSTGKLQRHEIVRNLIPTQGLNDILTQYLKGSNYSAAWYVGLVDNASFSAFAANDTAQQINGGNGWKEFSGYSGGARQRLTLGTSSGGSINNSANLATFTITANGTLKGGFLASGQAIGSTSGILYGEAAFSSTQAVTSGTTIQVQVTLTAATA